MSIRIRSTLGPATLLAVVLSVFVQSCETTDNRGAKRGAIGGAAVGLTMGALTGDAGLAVAGAVAGGVAGGAAGSMTDLEHDRDMGRTEMMADAIAGRPAGSTIEDTRPQSWDRIDDFVGEWRCSIWGLDADGNRITATSSWTGTLATTKSARLTMTDFDAADFDDVFDDSFGGYSQVSFDAATGYELLNVFSATPDDQRWVGERLTGEERYSFYYVGSSETGILGTARSDKRIELRFIGRDVIIVDTYAPAADGGETQVQSYRFTRS